MIGRPPRTTSFPYTTLFGSETNGTRHTPGGPRACSVSQLKASRISFPSRSDRSPVAPDGDASSWIELWSRSGNTRSEEHTSELQSRQYLVCRLLLEKKKKSQ